MQSGMTSLSRRTARILQVAGLVIPILLVVYGRMARQGLVDNSHYAGDTTFIILMTLWGILAVKQFVVPPTNVRVEMTQLALYHLFSGAYITLVAGFATAFVAAWVLLMFTSFAYYRKVGVISVVQCYMY